MKSILQICAFGSEKSGNFIPALLSLENEMTKYGFSTIYAFPEKARNQEWCIKLSKDHKVYFLPEAKARILPKTYTCVKKIYQENNIEIVHSHFELYDIPATLMAPKNIKVFWHLHDAIKLGYNICSKAKKLLYKFQYGIVSKRAILLTVSIEHGNFANYLGFKKENIFFVPNGINLDRIEIVKPNSNNKFLMFGWEVERKGVDVAVQSTQYIKNDNYQIIVIGQNACKEFIEKNNNSHILFLDPYENVNDIYKNVSCFLHISRAEGMSYALIEAIYAGLPVICSDILENQFANIFKNVTFVKVGDAKELANAIDGFVQKQGISFEEIVQNRSVIEKNYSLDSWCKKIISIYGC